MKKSLSKLLIWVLLGLMTMAQAIEKPLQNPLPRDPFKQTDGIEMSYDKNTKQQKLNLDFDEVPLRQALQALANIANINMVIGEEIQDKLSLHIKQISWQQALNIILKDKNLTVHTQDNLWFVHSNDHVKNKAHAQTSFIPIHYAMVEDIVALLKDNSFLSEHGKLGANKHLNAIWVEDDAARIIKIKKLIQEIDKPMKQVLITARIANVDDSFSRELGFKFGTRPSQEKKSEPESDLTMDLPNFNIKSGHFNAAIATVAQNNLLDLQLSALETEGRGKILSSPQLLTANRQAAYIEAGEEIPYQEQAGNGATNVSFKKAVLSLKVTPTITPNNKILLDLVVNQDKLSPITVNGIPAIQTRELRTQVMVENGATIILGGIYETLKNETIERIPVLGSLPLLGNFFKHKQSKIEQRELIVFVTPKVMD